MQNLAEELATEEGENKVLKRLQVIDMARGLLNSLVIDAEGEDYDFKTFQFSGINDVVSASCNMLSALSNIPQTILFGQAVGGMSSTDDTSMENYYNYIERIQRRMLKSNLRYLLSIIFQAGLATGEVDEVPKLKIEFNPLWSLSDLEQADLEQKREQAKFTRAQTAQIYVNMQAIDPSEVRQKLADSEEFDVEAMLDEYDDEDLFPEQIEGEIPAEAGGQVAQPESGSIAEEGSFSEYGQNVSVEEHNADPEEGGNAPAAAPAATKLPQDMSAEELEEKADKGVGNADGADGITNRPKDSVGVLVISNGRVLSGTRHNDFGYGLVCGPGGHVEPGETPVQAAFRETEEEFGISPKELIPLGRGPLEPDTGLRPHLFLCTDYEGEPDCLDLEMTGAKFRTMAELDELAASMFQPFADGLEILKTCIDTALFFGDDGGEMHGKLVDSIEKAVAGDPEKEDGGPGSGNHGHKGVPGEVGGSAPSGKSLSDDVRSAWESEDEYAIMKSLSSAHKKMAIGQSFEYMGTTVTKTGDDEFESEDPFGDKVKSSLSESVQGIADNYFELGEADPPVFHDLDPKDTAAAKIESGDLDPAETSAVKNSFSLTDAPEGQLIKSDGALWQKTESGDYMNLETGEIADAGDLQVSSFEELKYTGKTDFQYGSVSQETMDRKLWEMNRNQRQGGGGEITSKDVEEMVGSVKHYGLGGDCQMILATQDPESYPDLFETFGSTEADRESFAREAENVERFIALSDKVDGPIYRGISLNTSVMDPAMVQRTLDDLQEGNSISMRHITRYLRVEGTARRYADGVLDNEFEEGENYSIVYRVQNNRSAVSLREINPEGECLSPKSATYRVGHVNYEYDDDFEIHRYVVDLEEE